MPSCVSDVFRHASTDQDGPGRSSGTDSWPSPPLGALHNSIEQAEVTRILDAAYLIVAEHGVEGLTTTGVAERAGFAVGTLYSNFLQGIYAIADGAGVRGTPSAFRATPREAPHDHVSSRKPTPSKTTRLDSVARVHIMARVVPRSLARPPCVIIVTFRIGRPSSSLRGGGGGGGGSGGGGGGGGGEGFIDFLVDQGMANGGAATTPTSVLEAEVAMGACPGFVPLPFKRDPNGDPGSSLTCAALWDLKRRPHPTSDAGLTATRRFGRVPGESWLVAVMEFFDVSRHAGNPALPAGFRFQKTDLAKISSPRPESPVGLEPPSVPLPSCCATARSSARPGPCWASASDRCGWARAGDGYDQGSARPGLAQGTAAAAMQHFVESHRRRAWSSCSRSFGTGAEPALDRGGLDLIRVP